MTVLRDFCNRCRTRLLWSGGKLVCPNRECRNHGKGNGA